VPGTFCGTAFLFSFLTRNTLTAAAFLDNAMSAAAPEPYLEFAADLLHVRVYSDRASLGAGAAAAAADHLRALLASRPAPARVRVLFAAAPSQAEVLAGLVRARGIDWTRVEALHMDEYIGLENGAPQLFSSFLKRAVWDALPFAAVHALDGGSAAGPAAECARYAALLARAPLDLVLAGIGENGHLAFNDPPVADFADPASVKVVALDAACRQQQVNDGCFAALADVPTHALTLTLPALTPAGCRVICCVPGPTKRAAVSATLTLAPAAASCPASILRTNAAAALFVDGGERGSFDEAAAAPVLAAAAAGGAADGRDYARGGRLRVGADARGRIALLDRRAGAGGGAPRAAPWLAPGLVDLQVNGFGGVDFNCAAAAGGAALAGVARALRPHGVTTFLAALITQADDSLEANLAALAAAAGAEPDLGGALAGAHLEGPFISALDGYRGAHPAAAVAPACDAARWARWRAAARALRLRAVTLAAEVPGAAAFCAAAAADGALVALGHSAADAAAVAACVAAGARLATHLGNALPGALPRHPNALWAHLAADGLAASLIADGAHLPDDVLRVAWRVKRAAGAAGCVLVSDAAPLAGCAPGEYATTVGGRVVLGADGRLALAHAPGTLAGSTLTLDRGVARMLPVARDDEAARARADARAGAADAPGDDELDVRALRAAWDAASVAPAALIGLDHRLAIGCPADVVAFALGPPQDGDKRVRVLQVWKAGASVWKGGEQPGVE
jgi:glucosamine-6-phosphate deaminase